MAEGGEPVRFGSRLRSGLYFLCTFAEAVIVLAACWIRRRFGRPAWSDSRAGFLRIFLLHALRRHSPIRVTCAGRSDGAGAQAHTIMSAMCFARAHGHTYVHTPFTEIDHAEQSMPDWVAAWERLFNLGDGEKRPDSGTGRIYNYSAFHPRLFYALTLGFHPTHVHRRTMDVGSGRPERYFHPYFYYVDSNPEAFQAIIPDLRRKFWRGKTRPDNDPLSVALHMRRGDVSAQHGSRYTPIESVYQTAREIGGVLTGAGISHSMRLYSQGQADDFTLLRDIGVELSLDIDALWTMQQLISADILVMSKSSFSYVAALLSEGIKLYEPFWHPPMDTWLLRDSRGRFDQRKFKRQLEQRSGASRAACGQP